MHIARYRDSVPRTSPISYLTERAVGVRSRRASSAPRALCAVFAYAEKGLGDFHRGQPVVYPRENEGKQWQRVAGREERADVNYTGFFYCSLSLLRSYPYNRESSPRLMHTRLFDARVAFLIRFSLFSSFSSAPATLSLSRYTRYSMYIRYTYVHTLAANRRVQVNNILPLWNILFQLWFNHLDYGFYTLYLENAARFYLLLSLFDFIAEHSSATPRARITFLFSFIKYKCIFIGYTVVDKAFIKFYFNHTGTWIILEIVIIRTVQ